MLDKLKALLGLDKKDQKANNWTWGVMLACAAIAFFASFTLSVEYVELLKDPHVNLPCNINAVLNCASVMKTDQAHVLGFPNSFMGIAGEAVMVTVSVAYFAGARFKKWFYVAVNLGVLLSALFAYWLFFQSLYTIQILCPWCLLVTTTSTLMLGAITRFNLRENNFNLTFGAHHRIKKWLQKDYDKFIVAGWLVLLAALVFIKFPGIFD